MKYSLHLLTPLLLICCSIASAMHTDKQNILWQWIAELSHDKPDLAVIKQIALQKKVDVNTKSWVKHVTDINGTTISLMVERYAILEAAKQRDWQLIEILLNAGANPDTTVKYPDELTGYTPLHYATNGNSTSTVLALIKFGARINTVKNQLQRTPLRMAIHYRNSEMIQTLLAVGARTDIKDSDNRTDDDYARILGVNLDALRPRITWKIT